MQNEIKTSPAWMKWLLLFAGIYNLVWGVFVIVRPDLMFTWAGMEQPRYPELWQCIGMIVGVYGIGYAIAAFNPVRHWPIVLVGFLGKIFGPIGMMKALIDGTLPKQFATTCLSNDLIWWIPFGLILWHAYKSPSTRSPERES